MVVNCTECVRLELRSVIKLNVAENVLAYFALLYINFLWLFDVKIHTCRRKIMVQLNP